MSKAYDMVLQHLHNRHFQFTEDPDHETVAFGLSGGRDGNSHHIVIVVAERMHAVQVLTAFPLKVHPERRMAAAEAVLRATYGMVVGGFDMDLNDGEIRFRAVTIYGEDGPSEEAIERCIWCSIAMAERYLDAFMSVIYGGAAPSRAIGRAEAGQRSSQPDEGEPEDRAGESDPAMDDMVRSLYGRQRRRPARSAAPDRPPDDPASAD